MQPEAPSRRIAALVLPELLCELGTADWRLALHLRENAASPPRPRARGATSSSRSSKRWPLAVVVQHRIELDQAEAEAPAASPPAGSGERATTPPESEHASGGEEGTPAQTAALEPTSRLDAVNAEARRYGVREGQTIAEACALLAGLVVRSISAERVQETLSRVAEAALGFGATVAIEAPDTVWVDVTGVAHLFGDEERLALEMARAVRELGHLVRVAIANGPHTARALARWAEPTGGPLAVRVVPEERTARELAELPVQALPIPDDVVVWLGRVGVLTIADLERLPRAAAGPRLGERASMILDLCRGQDSAPLVAYRPKSVLVEASSWDEPVSGLQPLTFVLRGLIGRMSARLAGRGEAAQKLELVLLYDRGIARLNGSAPELRIHFDLASPLWREEELRRVVASRLERLRLEAPTVGMRIEAPAVIRALSRQLDFSRVMAGVTAGTRGMDHLPVLIAELSADIGKQRVGVLSRVDSHRPERQSRLAPALQQSRSTRKSSAMEPLLADRPRAPTRVLPQPVPLEAPLRIGATLLIDGRMCMVERVQFEYRLDAVEWWASQAVARDYVRLWFREGSGGFEALAYVDRNDGRRYLQAVAD